MLHDALRTLTEDAAELLESRLLAGEEIPFEVGETSGQPGRGGAALFAYRPLTSEFVSTHADKLRGLPSFDAAANHLARTRGTIAYLRLRDEPVLDVGELTHARLAVLAFLTAVWSDAEHFEPCEDRFEAAYSELESVALAERLVTTVFIPVHGVVLDCETVNLGAGVELIGPEDLDEQCLTRFSDGTEGADCFVAVSVDAPSSAPAPMPAVRHAARATLTALRMFKPGSVSLGLTAQADVGGAWQQVSLPFTGRAREEAWRLMPGEDEELRQFISAVRRIERRTRVAWALKRFEMGLERSVPAEGLTDFMAALRALLEANDDTGKAALPARVSALCARDAERIRVRNVVEAAFALERLATDGRIGRADRKRLGKQPPLEVIADTERYLRALLHDLVCGYLATDLKKLADEILLADGEPPADETASHDPVYLEPVPNPGELTADVAALATREFEAVFDDTAEINAVDTREDEPGWPSVEAAGHQPIFEPVLEDSIRIEPPVAEPPRDEDNVWTLRPAGDVNPPEVENTFPQETEEDELSADGSAGPEIPTYAEQETDTRMRQIAEDLVSDFDEKIEREEPRPTPLRRPVGEVGEADFTFDFKVLDPPVDETAASREPDRDERETLAEGDADFPVPEFRLPVGPGPALAESDSAVDGGPQRESLVQIMDENSVPPERDPNERPTTPLARDGRPHLVAIDGEMAREPDLRIAPAPVPEEPPALDPPRLVPTPPVVEQAAPETSPSVLQPTQEFDVLAEFGEDEPLFEGPSEPSWSPDFAEEEPRPPVTSTEQARTHAIGPPTIEFRPVVGGDQDDPDDFAGVC